MTMLCGAFLIASPLIHFVHSKLPFIISLSTDGFDKSIEWKAEELKWTLCEGMGSYAGRASDMIATL